jgi:hypothetical protein
MLRKSAKAHLHIWTSRNVWRWISNSSPPTEAGSLSIQPQLAAQQHEAEHCVPVIWLEHN